MERVKMLEPANVDDDVGGLFAGAVAMLGRVPNSYRVLGRTPLVAKFLLPFNAVLQREGAGSILSARLKEMVVIKTSQLNGCKY